MQPEDGGLTGGQQQPGWAPWASRKRMSVMALAGPGLAVLCIVLGLVTLGTHAGVAFLIFGCALAVFWVIAIPAARRRGKV